MLDTGGPSVTMLLAVCNLGLGATAGLGSGADLEDNPLGGLGLGASAAEDDDDSAPGDSPSRFLALFLSEGHDSFADAQAMLFNLMCVQPAIGTYCSRHQHHILLLCYRLYFCLNISRLSDVCSC